MQPGIAGLQPEQFRNYLLILARTHLHASVLLRRKLDASDIVQDTLLKAHQALSEFRGATEAEFMGWLRTILANQLADAARHFMRRKRDAALEESFRETLNSSSGRMARLAGKRTSPSQHVLRGERESLLAEALGRLPEDQATAVSLRYLAEFSVAEIATAMDRTQPAVAGLLRRGLKDLRERLMVLEQQNNVR